MIPLHPQPYAAHACPACQVKLEVRGWYMPGMRTLADLHCPSCQKEYYGDMPAGFGLYYPCLLDKQSGVVHDPNQELWYADWLRWSYGKRVSTPVGVRVEEFRPVRRPVLLNTLDHCYGHSLVKLLNAQYYIDQEPDADLVIVVQEPLRWMVPEGAAQVWTVDLPFGRGYEWNDWLAGEFRRRLEPWGRCDLSLAVYPDPADYSIERFTGVKPFADPEAFESCREKPVVTFVWREDRTWPDPDCYSAVPRLLLKVLRRARARLGWKGNMFVGAQQRRVAKLATRLRRAHPNLDFAVVGFGRPGGLPDWVSDLRVEKIDNSVVRGWCQRYAATHLVIGVHGSNMMLPSAHAGAILELQPNDRWRILTSSLKLSKHLDAWYAIYRYLFIPLATPPRSVAFIASKRLSALPTFHLYKDFPQHDHRALRRRPEGVAEHWHRIMNGREAAPRPRPRPPATAEATLR